MSILYGNDKVPGTGNTRSNSESNTDKNNQLRIDLIRRIEGLFTLDDNSVYNIRYADIDLYKNGEYLDNVTNYYISHNEHIDLMLKSQEIINKILKSPSTAKYPLYDQWSIVKNKENITVQCYVDAQNSFGAVGRSYFQIIFSNNVVTSLIFDGKEYNMS